MIRPGLLPTLLARLEQTGVVAQVGSTLPLLEILSHHPVRDMVIDRLVQLNHRLGFVSTFRAS